ncbi:MAG: NAD(P)/FAD-dependent oxidoreductase [Streptosporangiaceae bacterium]
MAEPSHAEQANAEQAPIADQPAQAGGSVLAAQGPAARPGSPAGLPGRRRVVIVGGGFAGLFAIRALRRSDVSVTLIDRAQHHLFQPLLYQCATGILSEGKIATPLRDLLKKHRNVDCVLAEVVDFDVAGQRVIAQRIGGDRIEYGYDDLIVAAGVRQSYFGHDEYVRWAPGMKTISDALAIRRRVYGAFEMADTAPTPEARRNWLTFALVGGGPTGVELAGQIRELATKTLRAEFRNIEPEDARVLLFDGGSAPLATFGPKLSGKAAATLDRLGVEQHMGSIVTHVDMGYLLVRDHAGEQTRYDANTVLWTAGVEAPPVAQALAAATGAKRDRAGRILVEKDLTIPGHPEISVLGDMMSLDKLPGVAEVAMQSGLHAGRRIRRRAAGDMAEKPFRYRDLGSAAYISRGQAVVSAGPLQVGGFIGWWIWLFIHIAFLTGFRNRVGALLTWWLAFTRDVRRERTFTTQEIETHRDIYQAPLRSIYPPVAPGVGADSERPAAGGGSASPAGDGSAPGPVHAGDAAADTQPSPAIE